MEGTLTSFFYLQGQENQCPSRTYKAVQDVALSLEQSSKYKDSIFPFSFFYLDLGDHPRKTSINTIN